MAFVQLSFCCLNLGSSFRVEFGKESYIGVDGARGVPEVRAGLSADGERLRGTFVLA